MPPQKKTKRKSTASATSEAKHVDAHPQLLPTKPGSPSKSSRRSPAKRPHGITQSQKELFIHNLQLEITFKARGLRAQANFEAAQLRSTLEQRLQRIPLAMRKANMGELLERNNNDQHHRVHINPPASVRTRISPAQSSQQTRKPSNPAPQTTRTRGVKRSSDEANNTSDKENTTVNNPKKRTRTGNAPHTTNHAARAIGPSQILSPKSNNARPMPNQSPSRLPVSPSKPTVARPFSPIKVSAPPKAAPRIATTAKSGQPLPRIASKQSLVSAGNTTRGKRPAPAPTTSTRRRSNASDRSSSAATTIVSKARKATGAGQTAAVATKKKAAFGGIPAKGKRVAAAVGKVEERSAAAAAAVGAGVGRVLRKRD